MGDVVDLDCPTRLDIPVERVLQSALESDLNRVMLIGWNKDDEFYFAASFADGGDALWLMEHAKNALISADDA